MIDLKNKHPKKLDLCPKMQPNGTVFHGQTLIKFSFAANLYLNRVFIPQFSLNLVNFLEISKFLAL